jgi:hypothetical protein
MKKIIMSIAGVIIIGLVVWGVSNNQKQSIQDIPSVQQATTTEATTTGNTVTLEDNRIPPEEPAASVDLAQELSFQYVPTLIQVPLQLGLNESGIVGGVTITPKKISDNRCPENIRCNKSGVARVTFAVVGPVTTKNIAMTEGQAFILDDVKVTLLHISPDQEKNEQIEESEYKFELQIELMK